MWVKRVAIDSVIVIMSVGEGSICVCVVSGPFFILSAFLTPLSKKSQPEIHLSFNEDVYHGQHYFHHLCHHYHHYGHNIH